MLTITVQPELAALLAEEARRRGTTPELLALEGVHRVLPAVPPPPPAAGSLLDFLAEHVSTVAGSSEPVSQGIEKEIGSAL